MLTGGRRPHQDGFTVLEVLLALALFGTVLVSAWAVFSSYFKAFNVGRDFADEHQNARATLEWITRRARMAQIAAQSSATPLPLDALNIVADLDRDGTQEQYRFCLDVAEGVIRQQRVSPAGSAPPATCTFGDPLTSRGVRPLRVIALEFGYYSGADEAPPVPPGVGAGGIVPGVGRVQITMVLDSNRSGVRDGGDLTLVSNAAIRNRE
ncbi:MAG: prepilin-type N-terminal cleavage/methylation domain-containing protein [Armatimonadota bacterium]|nr:prepilin-type N-terminal cleavage/methylation domain-containing protein [Armatimonadota bacterium]